MKELCPQMYIQVLLCNIELGKQKPRPRLQGLAGPLLAPPPGRDSTSTFSDSLMSLLYQTAQIREK